MLFTAINTLSEGIPSGGVAGQVWMSDGEGAGHWTDLPAKVIDDVSFTLTSLSITPSPYTTNFRGEGRLNCSIMSPSSLTGVSATLSFRCDISGLVPNTVDTKFPLYFIAEATISNEELLSGTFEWSGSGQFTPLFTSNYSTSFYQYDVINATKTISGTLILSNGSVYAIGDKPTSGEDWTYTGDINDVIDVIDSSTYSVLYDLEIIYGYANYFTPWCKVSAGIYQGITIGRVPGPNNYANWCHISIGYTAGKYVPQVTVDNISDSSKFMTITSLPTSSFGTKCCYLIRYKA